MKKIWVIPLIALLLTGCGKSRVFETVSDVPAAPVAATMQRILVQLPSELSTPALQSEQEGTLYLCDDYSVVIHTVQSGDLARTIQNATGMKKDDLQILQTRQGSAKRYQWVWTANGENGLQVGRGCVLDDGAYHYIITALADDEKAWQVQPAWKEIFASFRLTTDREEISTGS